MAQRRRFDKYDVYGPKWDRNLQQKSLGERFYSMAMTYRDKLHQIDALTGMAESNGALCRRCLKLASKMKQNGVEENDIIVVSSKAHCDQTVAVFATLMLGGVVAPIEPDLSYADCLSLLQRLRPKMVFADVRGAGQIERVLAEIGKLKTCTMVLFNSTQGHRLAFEKYLVDNLDEEFEPYLEQDPRKTAFIIPTQGATEPLNLACHSHHSIYLQAAYVMSLMNNVEKVISFFPLSWHLQVVITCLHLEKPVIRILPGSFEERKACRIIHDLKVDHAILGTEFTNKLLKHSSLHDYDVSCLECIVVGGYPTTPLDISNFYNKMPGVRFVQLYGTTETGCVCGTDENDQLRKNPGTVGKLFPGIRMRIVDVNTKNPLKAGAWGELTIRADSCMLGYYRNHMASLKAKERGFHRTDDIAEYDNEGNIYIKCKISDLIEYNGESFTPTTIEDIIKGHPYVIEVCVISNGKEIVACIVKKKKKQLTPDDISEFLLGKLPISHFPTKIRFFDQLPRTTIGKVKKNVLRNQIFRISIQHSKSITSLV